MNDRSGDNTDFQYNVFINCPFDEEYRIKLLRPLLFTVIFLGLNPRIASERQNSHELRLPKICELIKESKFSIHDLSRLKATEKGEVARMNMPLELGIDYGCRIYGNPPLNEKCCLILEKERYVYLQALSDLGGIDIKPHENEQEELIRVVRNWLKNAAGLGRVAPPAQIESFYYEFANGFYDARKEDGYSDKDLDMMEIPEYIEFIRDWVTLNVE